MEGGEAVGRVFGGRWAFRDLGKSERLGGFGFGDRGLSGGDRGGRGRIG